LLKSGIGKRLMVSVVLFSTVLTLLITLAQLYRDYKHDINSIEAQLQEVEDVHLRSLSALLWVSDADELNTHVQGILRLRDIQYIEIRDKEKQWVVAGKVKEGDILSRDYPLTHSYKDKEVRIGTLTVVAGLSGVYQRLYDKVITILVSNGIKTFLVAIFIFFIFHYLVTRHIVSIATFTKTLDINNQNKLILDRKQKKDDELDELVHAYNGMQSRLKNSIDKLNVSTARYRSLIEYSNAIPWEMDLATFRFTYVGKQAEKMLGYPLQDWYQENFWVNHIHQDDVEFAVAYSKKKAAQGKDHEYEYRMLAADGSVIWMREDAIVVQEDGVPVRLQGFMFDVTEQKTAEEALQHAYDKLEEKVIKRTRALTHAKNDAELANQLKTEFLGRVSHELRTPMNAILGFGQLLQAEKLEPEQSESLNEIMRAGQHLLYLIDDMLDLSVIETGNISLSFHDFKLDDWLDECLTLVQPMAEQRGIAIEVDRHSCNDTYLRMDRERLKEVLVNLLTNAIKYNRDDGNVVVQCERCSADKLRIRVIDSGPGLTDEQQSLMFEPFNRLGAEFSDTQGTGIGLTIARRLMGLMDGTIGVQSTVGGGSIFWIDCNISPAIVTTDYQAQDAVDLNYPVITDSCTVLCIEDNLANMRLIEKILANKKHIKLNTAPTAEMGLQLARQKIPDIILMDINLPGMDGYEALSRLRNYQQTRHIPIIAISAAASSRDIERGLAAGFHAYIAKPVNVAELLDTMERLVKKNVARSV
jgi:PAS domain S-box-containing protein